MRYVRIEPDTNPRKVAEVSAEPSPGYIDLGTDYDITGWHGVMLDADGVPYEDMSGKAAAARTALEPRLMKARRDATDAVGLGCEADCVAKRDALQAEYDAL